MSFINIINESFDKQNKNILTESKLTQLRKAFGEVADSYDTEELLSSIFPQFARKAYKIVKNHGYSGVFSEIDTQGDLGDGDGVIEDYMNDKTLKNSYLATMYSDYLENSYVDNDSSSAAVYIDIDDLTQYMDYEEFFDEDDEDED